MIILFAMPGVQELLIIFFALLMLFGGKAIPRLMRGIGEGIRDFKKAGKELNESLEEGKKAIK